MRSTCSPNGASMHSPTDKIPQVEWFKNTKEIPKLAKSHAQSKASDDDHNGSTASSNRRSGNQKSKNKGNKSKSESEGWSNTQIHRQLHQSEKTWKDVIILDSGSTIDATIANPDLIYDKKITELVTVMLIVTLIVCIT